MKDWLERQAEVEKRQTAPSSQEGTVTGFSNRAGAVVLSEDIYYVLGI